MNALKRHYHWVIAALVLLEMFVYIGIINNLVGLYLVPVTQSLGISRGSFSFAFSVRSVVSALVVILSGPVIRRCGYRRLAVIGLVAASLAYVNFGLSRNVYMLYASCILLGLCDGACSTAASVYLVGNWFHRYRGSILGLVTAATGIGGSAYCILITGVSAWADWRASLFVCAGTTALLALLFGIFIRNHPRDMGLKPLGEGESGNHKVRKQEKDHWHGFSFKELMKQPNFYLTLALVLLTNLCLCLAYYNMVPYLQDCGMTTAQAAAMQSVTLLVMAGVKLLCGVCSDWFGAKCVSAICCGFLSVSLFLFVGISGVTSAWAAVLCFSLGLPLMSVMIPLLTASLFGYAAHNSISGIFLAMPSLAAVVANPVANIVHDRIGTYRPAFLAAAILSVVIFGLYILSFILANRDRKKTEEETLW